MIRQAFLFHTGKSLSIIIGMSPFECVRHEAYEEPEIHLTGDCLLWSKVYQVCFCNAKSVSSSWKAITATASTVSYFEMK